MTQRVNFKIAKLLKQKGYNVMPFYIEMQTDYVKGYYCDDDFTDEYVENEFQFEDHVCSHLYLAPTIGEVVEWIYTKYGVWLGVSHIDSFLQFQFTLDRISYNETLQYDNYCDFKTPEEAYFAGIEQYLNTYVHNL